MIVLTGANRGIGYEIGKLLSQQYLVVAVTRDDIRLDYPCIQVQHDITQDNTELFDKITKHVTPSVLINCAGVCGSDDMIDVNLMAAIDLTEAFINCTEHGHVIHFGSLSREYPDTDAVYTATKVALESYIKNKRKQTPTHKFTTLIPGYVMTDMISDFVPDYRPLCPIDVAQTIEFVLSRPSHVELREIVLSSSYQREC